MPFRLSQRSSVMAPVMASAMLRVGAALLIALALSSPSLRAQATSASVQKLQHVEANAFDSFGRSIAVDGSRALITAHAVDNKGTAFSYRRVSGVWTLSETLRGLGTEVGDAFGWRADMDGAYAVVSAHQVDVLPQVNLGAVYVYRDDGTNWNEVQKLMAPDGEGNDLFGWSIALAGDLIVVGAIDDDDSGNLTGSVYVFRRAGTTWVFEQKLHASSNDEQDEFGFVVETDGQTILASSVVDATGGVPIGAVYAFRHDGTSWVETQRIVPPDGAADDWFGWDLALDGDRLAVGAPNHTVASVAGGAAYTYRFDGATWLLEDQFAPGKLSTADAFGWSVALQGDRLLAGAPSTTLADGSPDLFDGALYQFHFDGTRWVEVHQWISSDVAVAAWPGPNLGFTCALDGKTVFAGAPYHDGGAINSGATYRFELTDLGLEAVPPEVSPSGPLALRTSGGLSGGQTVLLLTTVDGMPLATFVVWPNVFDVMGKAELSVGAVPAALSGFTAEFTAAGYWHAGPYALSNPVIVSFL